VKSRQNLSFGTFLVDWKRMRILTVGFNDEYVKELEKELDKYFICIVDNAKICMMRPILPTLDIMNRL
jgi:hypothetical protein